MNSLVAEGSITHPALAGLDPEQAEVVQWRGRFLCVIAGAGCGKTRTVAHRIAHLDATGDLGAKHVLAVTHTRKAAGELRERLRALGVHDTTCKTFHAAALGLVRRFDAEAAQRELITDSWPYLKRIVYGSRRTNEDENGVVSDLKAEIELAQARLQTAETLSPLHKRPTEIPRDQLGRVWEEWDAQRVEMGLVDFSDYLSIATGLLTGDAEVAATIRDEWRSVVVDEYQDIDPAQQAFLAAILGDDGLLCAVGDPRQTIFSFKGSEPSFLTDFDQHWPGSEIRYLNRSYRSTPQIVSVANRISRSTGKPEALTAQGADGPTDDGPQPIIRSTHNTELEAQKIADMLAAAHMSGTSWSEMAILYRLNFQSAALETALRRQGIPFNVVGDRLFYEVDAVLEVLRPFGQDARYDEDQDGLGLLSEHARRRGWNPFDAPAGTGTARRRWEYHNTLVEQAEAFVAEHGPLTAAALRTAFLNAASRDAEPTTDNVTLATIHKAKGLEWDSVYLYGTTEGMLPFYRATSAGEEAVKEERRLFYVAVTRARRDLTITHATIKTSRKGWETKQERSRFVLDVVGQNQPVFTAGSGYESPAGGGLLSAPAVVEVTNCPTCRKILNRGEQQLGSHVACLTGDDAATATSVLAWRDRVASELGKKPTQIATDELVARWLAHRPDKPSSSLFDMIPQRSIVLQRFGDDLLKLL